jgi:hypothetical protein
MNCGRLFQKQTSVPSERVSRRRLLDRRELSQFKWANNGCTVGKHTDELIEQLVVSSEEKRLVNGLTVMIGAVTSESYLQRFSITSAHTKRSG